MKDLARRNFLSIAALFGAGLASSNSSNRSARNPETAAPAAWTSDHLESLDGDRMADEIKNEKIRRALLAGPSIVTSNATVAEMNHQGNLTTLRPGTNDWVCIPGDQNIVGRPDMALDPMGMVWFRTFSPESPNQQTRRQA